MKPGEMAELKNMVIAEYQEKLKLLEQEKRKKLEAIDIVAGLSGAEGPLLRVRTTVPPEPTVAPVSGVDKVVSAVIIREAVASLDDGAEFTSTQIRERAKRNHPGANVSRNSLSTVLCSLKETGKIKIEQEKRGTIPAVYKKVGEQEKDNNMGDQQAKAEVG